ncbi:hypothetical protein [Rhizobium halophilum]|uniref:hypothetical protein n=1 Tax=Rhizobium halophilum TaxID=2846852 RepID=UPI001EFC968D|nr:hypothetical protein [Rhizobium halophilum]MCF6369493.1 hypothetical protein [Rhizobium halophilum]
MITPVAVKMKEQQARWMLFRTRDLMMRQRTQLINTLRGHLLNMAPSLRKVQLTWKL